MVNTIFVVVNLAGLQSYYKIRASSDKMVLLQSIQNNTFLSTTWEELNELHQLMEWV